MASRASISACQWWRRSWRWRWRWGLKANGWRVCSWWCHRMAWRTGWTWRMRRMNYSRRISDRRLRSTMHWMNYWRGCMCRLTWFLRLLGAYLCWILRYSRLLLGSFLRLTLLRVLRYDRSSTWWRRGGRKIPSCYSILSSQLFFEMPKL